MIPSHLPRFGIISFVFFSMAVCSSGKKENGRMRKGPEWAVNV